MRLSSGEKVNARLSKTQYIRDRLRPLTKVAVAGIHQGNAQVSVEAQESEYLSLGMIGFSKLIQTAQQSFGTSISCESSIERGKHH
ncbi:hypothetical protein Peur_069933 [Populus x canadensis]